MLPPDSMAELPEAPIVLLTGATGYVGGLLVSLLEKQQVKLRCLARNPDKLWPLVRESTQIVRGDVLDATSLDEALQGVQTAYYLVHLMSGSEYFEKEDRQAAENFAVAARKAGVQRIIYLGGLGDDGDGPGDYYEAVDAGWFRIRFVPQNVGENFIGLCPNCDPNSPGAFVMGSYDSQQLILLTTFRSSAHCAK